MADAFRKTKAGGYGSRLKAGTTAIYFIAPKRLSNEFDETIGADPAT